MTRRLYLAAYLLAIPIGVALEMAETAWAKLLGWLERKSQE